MAGNPACVWGNMPEISAAGHKQARRFVGRVITRPIGQMK
jgi:hypothetical protein